jgi:hypothetical protein
MSNKTAWINDEYMVPIKTTLINCKMENNDTLDKVIVQDSNDVFYYRDANTFGGGPAGPTGPRGATGATGIQGPTGPNGAGTGDVNGPASSTNKALAIFNGLTGKLIMNSGITTDSTGQGLVFSNSTLTSSDDQLDYYELYEYTSDFSSTLGGGVVISAMPISIFRMGKLIMCKLGKKSGNQIVTGALQSAIPIPFIFRPSDQTTLYGISIYTDSAEAMGALSITPSGFIQLAPLSTGSLVSLGQFPGSGGVGTKTNGIWQDSYVSWLRA